MSNGKYLVVSCDGGGIRGLVTTLLLQDLGQSLLDNVDFWSGTSAGSVVSLGMAGGLGVDELAEIYASPEFCRRLFTPYESGPARGAREEPWEAVHQALESAADEALGGLSGLIDSLLFPQYSEAGRLGVMQQYLPDLTLEQMWRERQKRVLVATFFLNQELPDGRSRWLPTTLHNLPGLPNSGRHDATTLVGACMASTALPIFWQGYELTPGRLFADGGLYAANPSTVTLASLVGSGLLEEQGLAPKDVFMLSVGTGFNPASYPSQSPVPAANPWGILGWLWPHASPNVGPFPLMDAVMDSSVTIDSFQSQMLLGKDNYRRADVDLGQNLIAANDCSAVPQLRQITDEYLGSPQWAAIKEWVVANFE